MLEMLPNLARLLALHALLQRDHILQVLVEIRRALPVLSQMICLDVSWLVAAVLVDLEHLILLIEVHDIVVGQFLDQKLDWAGGRQVDVMDCRLGHDVQAVV